MTLVGAGGAASNNLQRRTVLLSPSQARSGRSAACRPNGPDRMRSAVRTSSSIGPPARQGTANRARRGRAAGSAPAGLGLPLPQPDDPVHVLGLAAEVPQPRHALAAV